MRSLLFIIVILFTIYIYFLTHSYILTFLAFTLSLDIVFILIKLIEYNRNTKNRS
jgi:uncharacterized membrane protein